MLGLAGLPLGMHFRFLEPDPDAPASALGEVVSRRYGEIEAVDELADGVDVVTYEFENVSIEVARHIAERVPVHPSPAALEMSQDRRVEKDGFRSLGVPTADYRPVDTFEELTVATSDLGFPCVLKTRRMGYDGKGQAVLRSPEDLPGAWTTLGERPLILERFIPFDRELSIVAARSREGEIRCYPLVQNEHRDGILCQTVAPAPDVSSDLQARAESYCDKIMEALEYVGVVAIELFQFDGELLANEMAPRVHNSGHWTQDGAACCQFENHLRAVAGLPLGEVEPVQPTTMINLIGTVPDLHHLLALPGVHLHLYGKEPRPGRKLGHVNVVGHQPETVVELRRLAGLE
jgi:5-(carboxyamino)imidazole ribonucleotide synthase